MSSTRSGTSIKRDQQDIATVKTLDVEKIVKTISILINRIEERFPGSGLANVARELEALAETSVAKADKIARPNLWIRGAVGIFIVLCVVALAYSVDTFNLNPNLDLLRPIDKIQLIEPALNVVVYIVAAIVFLVTVENRFKRQRALEALHELRAITHVIDMHQLTKDPSSLLSSSTSSSPKRMSSAELLRYLDYCTELLSLTAKLAAIYGQSTRDTGVATSVTELERLTTDLSRKVWQKIASVKLVES